MPIEDGIVSGGTDSPEMHDLFSVVGESSTHHAISEAVRLKLIELEIEKTKLEQCKLQPSTPQERVGFRPREAHLPVMAESGDPLAFFGCFKKTLQLNGVSVSAYAKLLPSHLNERAKRVFAALSYEQCLDYSFVKSQIIASFRASAGSYLDKFRSIRRSGTENQKMFVGRLTETFSYYLEAGELKTLNDLKEAVILEQFFATLDGATKQFVKTTAPKLLWKKLSWRIFISKTGRAPINSLLIIEIRLPTSKQKTELRVTWSKIQTGLQRHRQPEKSLLDRKMRVLSATLLIIGRPSVRSNPLNRKLTGRTFAGKMTKQPV